MKKIIFYKKENGKVPLEDFLDSIKNKELRIKIIYKIKLLSLGLLGQDEVKYIRYKIYEIRVKDSSNISRIFYFNYLSNDIILLDAIIKKENKLKNTVLTRILEYKNDYIKRIG